jgi:hypothetical protein
MSDIMNDEQYEAYAERVEEYFEDTPTRDEFARWIREDPAYKIFGDRLDVEDCISTLYRWMFVEDGTP